MSRHEIIPICFFSRTAVLSDLGDGAYGMIDDSSRRWRDAPHFHTDSLPDCYFYDYTDFQRLSVGVGVTMTTAELCSHIPDIDLPQSLFNQLVPPASVLPLLAGRRPPVALCYTLANSPSGRVGLLMNTVALLNLPSRPGDNCMIVRQFSVDQERALYMALHAGEPTNLLVVARPWVFFIDHCMPQGHYDDAYARIHIHDVVLLGNSGIHAFGDDPYAAWVPLDADGVRMVPPAPPSEHSDDDEEDEDEDDGQGVYVHAVRADELQTESRERAAMRARWTPYFLDGTNTARRLLFVTSGMITQPYMKPVPAWCSDVRAQLATVPGEDGSEHASVWFQEADGEPQMEMEMFGGDLQLDLARVDVLISDVDVERTRTTRIMRAMQLLQRDPAFEHDRIDTSFRLYMREKMIREARLQEAQAEIVFIHMKRKELLRLDPLYMLLVEWEDIARGRLTSYVRLHGDTLALAAPSSEADAFVPQMLGAPYLSHEMGTLISLWEEPVPLPDRHVERPARGGIMLPEDDRPLCVGPDTRRSVRNLMLTHRKAVRSRSDPLPLSDVKRTRGDH